MSGISIVVLSYERIQALETLLHCLLKQELPAIDLELMICNNSARIALKKSRWSRLGRLFNRFRDLKIFNSSHNWASRLRYSIATLARYETIMFVDDDIMMLDQGFVSSMLKTFNTLNKTDILSCWNTLWVGWGQDDFSYVSMNFRRREITDLTESDTAGPGICMFNKQLLLSSNIVNQTDNFPIKSDLDFSLLAALEWGSRTYYLPSYGMLDFHPQCSQKALYKVYGKYEELYGRYKAAVKRGYRPVVDRMSEISPEQRLLIEKAIGVLPITNYSW
jgi:hypothetical protein